MMIRQQAKAGTNIINTTHLCRHKLSMPSCTIYAETMSKTATVSENGEKTVTVTVAQWQPSFSVTNCRRFRRQCGQAFTVPDYDSWGPKAHFDFFSKMARKLIKSFDAIPIFLAQRIQGRQKLRKTGEACSMRSALRRPARLIFSGSKIRRGMFHNVPLGAKNRKGTCLRLWEEFILFLLLMPLSLFLQFRETVQLYSFGWP